MKVFSSAEENYLKIIYQLSLQDKGLISTGSIGKEMKAKPSSVTDMLTKLKKKGAIEHTPYKGVSLTKAGKQTALHLLRKHRLWEVFLVEKLDFKWDKIHEIAEQLEHIESPELVDKLDAYLGFPQTDPHGHPIPDKDGRFVVRQCILLSEVPESQKVKIVRVEDDTPAFLQYLDANNLKIGNQLVILKRINFDKSLELNVEHNRSLHVSQKVAENILVIKLGY